MRPTTNNDSEANSTASPSAAVRHRPAPPIALASAAVRHRPAPPIARGEGAAERSGRRRRPEEAPDALCKMLCATRLAVPRRALGLRQARLWRPAAARAAARPLGLRALSAETGPDVKDDSQAFKDLKWADMSTFEKTKYAVGKYGMYTLVGGSFALVIGRTSMYLTSTMMGLSFKTVGWWGFLAGYGAGIGTTAALYAATRALYIRPENVRRQAFNLVARSPQVKADMGVSLVSPLRSGVMRAYTMTGGHVALDSDSRSIVWRQPRVKMLFQVYGGQKHQAIVSAEAVRTWNGLEFESVSVDYVTKEAEHPVLVAGTREHAEVEGGNLRDLVQLKRRYVD